MTDLPALLKRARELTEEATEGPWYFAPEVTGVRKDGTTWCLEERAIGHGPNVAAIVAWRSLILPLLVVAEAAASVCSEDKVREELLCYVMGSKLLDALAKLGEVKL